MRKTMTFILLIISTMVMSSVSFVSIEAKQNNNEYQPRYETWSGNMSEEELMQYYIENDIKPANAPEGSEEMLQEYKVSGHLTTRFSQYTTWTKSSNNAYVADIYGNNPLEIKEADNYIKDAKKMLI